MLISVILFVSFTSCTYMNPTELIHNEDDIQLYDYYVDELGNEGVVVYISNDSTNVMVLSSDEGYAAWGPTNLQLSSSTGVDSAERLSMHMMTMAVAYKIVRFPAFQWCYKKNGSGPVRVTDWMLPTEREILLWLRSGCNFTKLNDALVKIGGTPVSQDELYWTSTEDMKKIIHSTYSDYGSDYMPDMRAVCINLSLDSKYKMIYWIKSREHRVRAVKYIRLKGRN